MYTSLHKSTLQCTTITATFSFSVLAGLLFWSPQGRNFGNYHSKFFFTFFASALPNDIKPLMVMHDHIIIIRYCFVPKQCDCVLFDFRVDNWWMGKDAEALSTAGLTVITSGGSYWKCQCNALTWLGLDRYLQFDLNTVTYYCYYYYWLGGVVVRALDSRSTGCGFDYQPLHCRATTLVKLFTPMCFCSPSSIIWYLARAFMLTRLYVAAIHGSNEQVEYCSSSAAAILIA